MAFSTPMLRPLEESQGSSPLQGHGSWLMCGVALSLPGHMRFLRFEMVYYERRTLLNEASQMLFVLNEKLLQTTW